MPKTKPPAKTIPGNAPTQIRFTASDKSSIEAIRERYGLPSIASAVRFALETTRRKMGKER